MIELTPTARTRLNEYFDELRRVLSGSPAVDLGEVEMDVRDHINSALSSCSAPVDEATLNSVLRELGSPAQWSAGDERPWYRKTRTEVIALAKQCVVQFLHFVAESPESYRLAYLSLLVLVIGWCSVGVLNGNSAFVFSNVATLASFVLSRAALSVFGSTKLSSGQKWLLYPGLLTVYIPFAALLLFGLAGMSGTYIKMVLSDGEINHVRLQKERIHRLERLGDNEKEAHELALRALRTNPLTRIALLSPIGIACVVIAAMGLNWLLIGLCIALFPGTFRNIFHPFLDGITRWSGVVFGSIGFLMSLCGLTILR
jgi:hypothetical protein